MLEEMNVPHSYREYRDDPLSTDELRSILALLDMGPRDLLRPKEAKAHGVADDLSDADLIETMAGEPTLVQRPIALFDGRAILARPADKLVEFLK